MVKLICVADKLLHCGSSFRPRWIYDLPVGEVELASFSNP